ncbi:MFS transporter [Arthrobacter sp. Y-9]|uniref:MFS transporter n=1 Tax=Arthrobacter sp. Y-9 TaxID=3039385 RepID=UPI00241CD44A|nr:MFS transporter [Arthrobacter sp. Y-9]WFR83049.1 MFS transporter [Arthrobacter sp. Y-9]
MPEASPAVAGGLTDDGGRARAQRRTLAVVVISQVLGGAGLAAGITVGALLAQEMLGNDGVSGLPTALFTLGSALAAYLVGRTTQRFGRRPGLAFGFGAGALGAAGVVLSAILWNPVLLFVSLFLYGGGSATNLQARYAGTDLATADQRGRAVSIALVSTTLGAVAGPNLVEPLGALARSWGLPVLSGPFLLAAVAYAAAGLVLWVLLRPDPYRLARELRQSAEAAAEAPAVPETPAPASAAVEPVRKPARHGVALAALIMVLTQVTMTAIMTMTPVHMRAHHHGLGEVGLVIGVHIGAMYLPSLVTGWLVDRIGRVWMACAGGLVLVASAVLATLAPSDSLGLLLLALALLGLGWNFGLITATALLVDATEPESRARVQGGVDVLVALSGAGGSAMAGVVMAAGDYSAVTLGGGVLALLLIPVVLWSQRTGSIRRTAP